MTLGAVKMPPSVEDYETLKDQSEKPFDNMMFLGDVLAKLKMGKTALYVEIRLGLVPKPMEKKYKKKSVWRRDEIEKCWDEKTKAFK